MQGEAVKVSFILKYLFLLLVKYNEVISIAIQATKLLFSILFIAADLINCDIWMKVLYVGIESSISLDHLQFMSKIKDFFLYERVWFLY